MQQIELSRTFASSVVDFDARRATDRDIARLRAWVYERKVVAIRNQQIDRGAYLDFARRFGACEHFRFKNYHEPDYPDILRIDNRNGGTANPGARKLGNMWHSDSSYLARPLPLTFLHAHRVTEGWGDTLFVDMEAALRALPIGVRERIAGRQAIHDVRWTYKVKEGDVGESVQEIFLRLDATFPAVSHPTVVRHPHTGRESLYMSPGYTTGMEDGTAAEGHALLAEIFAHVLRTEQIYTHRWEPNDLLIWDNRSVIHSATELPPDVERVMFRIGIDDGGFFRRDAAEAVP